MAGREGLGSMRYQSLLSAGWAQITCPQPSFSIYSEKDPSPYHPAAHSQGHPSSVKSFWEYPHHIPIAHQMILNPNRLVMNTVPGSLCVLHNRIITETACQSHK